MADPFEEEYQWIHVYRVKTTRFGKQFCKEGLVKKEILFRLDCTTDTMGARGQQFSCSFLYQLTEYQVEM